MKISKQMWLVIAIILVGIAAAGLILNTDKPVMDEHGEHAEHGEQASVENMTPDSLHMAAAAPVAETHEMHGTPVLDFSITKSILGMFVILGHIDANLIVWLCLEISHACEKHAA